MYIYQFVVKRKGSDHIL